MIDGKENVVRVLFPNKVLHGRVMGGAFVLRPHREEENISVLRMAGPTFAIDLSRLDAGRKLQCAVMNVEEIRNVQVIHGGNILSCDVVETGEIVETSHAGIVVKVNGQQLIGGHESDIEINTKSGDSMDTLVLAAQHKLALLAQKGLTSVSDII